MRIAILGVGLIGGSIGLAARRRLDAEVAGFDPDGERLARAGELGAIGSAHDSVAAAVEGAELVFCAAPVGALPALAAEALAAAGENTAVTDVGSVKRDAIVALGEDARFIGGHPLAGAETSGVENASADLFEGARWYLTPTPSTGGVIYDRVQRTVADLGARPQAIDAEAHDRLMATISHLPHVLANLLVGRATEAEREGGERLPEVGPSFRDATRVAGANPVLWSQILGANREAVAAEIDAFIELLGEARDELRGEDAESLRDGLRERQEAVAASRRELLESGLAGGPLTELRVRVPNRPGIVAEIALALGNGGVNIEDMALHPAADMRSGAISLYVAGDDQAERATSLVRELGHDVSRVDR